MYMYSAGTYAMCVCSILLGVVIGGLREGDCDLLDELVDAAGALVGEHGVEVRSRACLLNEPSLMCLDFWWEAQMVFNIFY